MENILDLPIEAPQNRKYAEFGTRFAAAIVDGALLWIVKIAAGWILLEAVPLGFSFVNIMSIAVNALYFGILESSAKQASVGKMAMGIKVGDRDGNRISFANAVGRYFGKILSGLLLLIGYLMAAWDSKRQALHDKLADTYVYEKA